ncbi:class I SAM-dependent methyltransferase [Sphingomonas adhaesiva]|uniref:class I SAM-dependent methyltransferase n=1 Tax=Sphingomonas adhaesiva TaxID=28212 RepID=UPI002FFB8D0A
MGQVWADEWRRTERAFAGIAAVLDAAIAAVAPQTGRALDIGCGVGSTTLALAGARPALEVTGTDLAAPLIAVARERAATVPTAVRPAFVVQDALTLAAERAPLDLLVSRHGVMFFDDPVAGFAALRGATRVGAPLVFSCFRDRARNDWSHAVDRALGVVPMASGYAPGPYALADEARTAAILRDAGWRDVTATAHAVPYVVGAGEDPVADAIGFYRRIGSAASLLAAAAPAERAAMERTLADMLATRIQGGAVTFTAAIWIWTARAGEPA